MKIYSLGLVTGISWYTDENGFAALQQRSERFVQIDLYEERANRQFGKSRRLWVNADNVLYATEIT
jgi:hypothetical protein